MKKINNKTKGIASILSILAMLGLVGFLNVNNAQATEEGVWQWSNSTAGKVFPKIENNWYSVASSSDGTKLAAVEYDSERVYTSSDSGSTWTRRNGDYKSGLSIASSADGMKLATGGNNGDIYTSVDGGATWTDRGHGGYWSSMASSTDGMKLIAGDKNGGYIYTSTDGGENWTQQDFTTQDWYSVTISADGEKMAAICEDDAELWVSTDGGNNWTQSAYLPPSTKIAYAADGSILAAVTWDGIIRTSIDDGANWVDHDAMGGRNWKSVAVSSNGARMSAVIDGGNVWTSIDSGDTWTEQHIPSKETKGWDAIASSADGMKLVAVIDWDTIYTSIDGGENWIPQDVARHDEMNWDSIASSADGTKLAAVDNYSSTLWLSDDSGATWTEQDNINNLGSGNPYSVASSSDGMTLVVGEFGGYLLTSTDRGDSWTRNNNQGDWQSVAASADGVKLMASDSNDGYFWTSDDSGETWSQQSDNYGFYSVASSADGTRLIAGQNCGNLYTSNNSGQSWTEHSVYGCWNRGLVASSADGMKLVAADNDENHAVYTSIDGGDNWVLQENAPSIYWNKITMSADGDKLTGLGQDGFIYNSIDGGVTWNQQTEAGNREWSSVASSADGNKIAAGVWGGDIYTASTESAWTVASINQGVQWSALAASEDGVNMIGAVQYGNIYTSDDSGETWTKRISSGERDWRGVATSTNGMKLAAVDYASGYIYTSADGGATWTAREDAGTASWVSIASSNDGEKLAAVNFYNGSVSMSVDGGGTWNMSNIEFNRPISIASSADGQTLAVAEGAWSTSGNIWVSTDAGINWNNATDSLDAMKWYGVVISADGTKIAGSVGSGNGTGYIYTGVSNDNGATWNWTQRTDAGERNWKYISASSNGMKIAAAADKDYIYLSEDGGVTWNAQVVPGMHTWGGVAVAGDGSSVSAAIGSGSNGEDGYVWRAFFNTPVNDGADADKFLQDILSGFISVEGSNPTETNKVTFNTGYTITADGAQVVFPAGTEMTKVGGGNMDFTAMDFEDITAALRGATTSTIDGAVSIGIPGLNLSFSHNITVTIPVSAALNGQTINVFYQSAGQTDWTNGITCAVTNGLCVFQTNHATKYSAGDDPIVAPATVVITEEAQKAHIDSFKAYEYNKSDSKCVRRLRVEINGKHFDKDAEVKIGNVEAFDVERKSSKRIIAKFCLEKLLKAKTTLKRVVSVANPDADTEKADKKINLEDIEPDLSHIIFDMVSKEGIKHIQQALVKLGYLNVRYTTGNFGPITTEAVKKFQGDNGISQTGFVGPMTNAELQEKLK